MQYTVLNLAQSSPCIRYQCLQLYNIFWYIRKINYTLQRLIPEPLIPNSYVHQLLNYPKFLILDQPSITELNFKYHWST